MLALRADTYTCSEKGALGFSTDLGPLPKRETKRNNMDDDTAKPRYIFRYHIYSLNPDGSEGLFLGDVYAYTADEALEDAERAFLKQYKNGVKVVDASLN